MAANEELFETLAAWLSSVRDVLGTKRDALSVSDDAERPVPDERRNVTRRPEE